MSDDILAYLSAPDRYKFQQLLMEANCGAILVPEGLKNKKCQFCKKDLYGPKSKGAVMVWSEDFGEVVHLCIARECILRAPTLILKLRRALEEKKKPTIWYPGRPLDPLIKDVIIK